MDPGLNGDNSVHSSEAPSGKGASKGGKSNKRRSKKDKEDRSFKCDKCEKTYLSYPALYTHTKLKHSQGEDGKPVLPVFSGRGRGRPRKNNSHRVDPISTEFFEQSERAGGPTDPLSGFDEALAEVCPD